MNRILVGAAVAVVLFDSAAAYAATSTPAPATPAPTTTPTPPDTLKCKAPEVPTQVKDKDGKMVWKCVKPKTP